MQYNSRGKYEYRNRAKQLLRFDGLNFPGNVTPMDIDALIEFHDKKIVLVEVKLGKTPVPDGERKAIERMVRDFAKANKDALAIVAEHTVFNTNEDVYMKECMVREVLFGKEWVWRAPKEPITVGQAIELFLCPKS